MDNSIFRNNFEIGENGEVTLRWPGTYSTKGELISQAKDRVQEYFSDIQKEIIDKEVGPGYWRWTNNKNEHTIAAKGNLQNSVNHVDGTTEKGISVADHLGYGVWGYKYVYRVQGRTLGEGSDGEPLLDPKSLKVTKSYMTEQKTQKLLNKDREAFLSALASKKWSLTQYKQITTNPEFDNLEPLGATSPTKNIPSTPLTNHTVSGIVKANKGEEKKKVADRLVRKFASEKEYDRALNEGGRGVQSNYSGTRKKRNGTCPTTT